MKPANFHGITKSENGLVAMQGSADYMTLRICQVINFFVISKRKTQYIEELLALSTYFHTPQRHLPIQAKRMVTSVAKGVR